MNIILFDTTTVVVEKPPYLEPLQQRHLFGTSYSEAFCVWAKGSCGESLQCLCYLVFP